MKGKDKFIFTFAICFVVFATCGFLKSDEEKLEEAAKHLSDPAELTPGSAEIYSDSLKIIIEKDPENIKALWLQAIASANTKNKGKTFTALKKILEITGISALRSRHSACRSFQVEMGFKLLRNRVSFIYLKTR